MPKKLECIIRSHDQEVDITVESDKMIDAWLEKNEPSIKIKHNEPIPHIVPNGSIGSKNE